ncbi:hypothetical protein [Paenibacillus nasutitermitis]|uniref:hypothetical protein n=1 Tax=Paenibacillus nasutitermitis TaxID=1652958 RepID=UPI001E5712D9|nr:hypothetical protein [Paenibacillus nasutitermitis]
MREIYSSGSKIGVKKKRPSCPFAMKQVSFFEECVLQAASYSTRWVKKKQAQEMLEPAA